MNKRLEGKRKEVEGAPKGEQAGMGGGGEEVRKHETGVAN